MDYGTLNPCSMGLWGMCDGVWYRIREYYHSGRDTRRQLTDDEYYAELEKLIDGLPVESIIVDPSAASFIALITKKRRYRPVGAYNAVLDGIRYTSAALRRGLIQIQDCCADTITEFQSYRWDEKVGEDRPIKESDHAMDDIRYFVSTILFSGINIT